MILLIQHQMILSVTTGKRLKTCYYVCLRAEGRQAQKIHSSISQKMMEILLSLPLLLGEDISHKLSSKQSSRDTSSNNRCPWHFSKMWYLFLKVQGSAFSWSYSVERQPLLFTGLRIFCFQEQKSPLMFYLPSL